MKGLFISIPLLLMGTLAAAQSKSVPSTPPSVISVIEGISGKRFVPDTAFTALSEQDEALLAKEPMANWGLLQESGKEMAYSNLVIGTRSYQLVITRPPRSSYPTATLLRYTTPQSKPEPIARGTLQPKVDEKAK